MRKRRTSPWRGRRRWSAKVQSRFQSAFQAKLRAKAGRKASSGGSSRRSRPGPRGWAGRGRARTPPPARTSRSAPIRRPGGRARSRWRRKSTPLAGAGLAGPGGPRLEAQRHVHHPQPGDADQQLQQDLEADRAELDAVDEAPPAEEEPGERIGAPPRLVEEHPRDQPGAAADQVARQPGEAAGAPPGDVPAGHHQVGARLHGGQHLGDQLGRVLEVGVHDADELAPCHVEAGDDRGAQPARPARRPAAAGSGPRGARPAGSASRDGGGVVAVVDEADLGVDAGEGRVQPRPERRRGSPPRCGSGSPPRVGGGCRRGRHASRRIEAGAPVGRAPRPAGRRAMARPLSRAPRPACGGSARSGPRSAGSGGCSRR